MQATLAFWCGCSQQDSRQAEVWLGQPFTDSWGLLGCTDNLICIERARISAFIMGTNHKRACILCNKIHRQHTKVEHSENKNSRKTKPNKAQNHSFLPPCLFRHPGEGSEPTGCCDCEVTSQGARSALQLLLQHWALYQDRRSALTTYQIGAFNPLKVGLLSFENTK